MSDMLEIARRRNDLSRAVRTALFVTPQSKGDDLEASIRALLENGSALQQAQVRIEEWKRRARWHNEVRQQAVRSLKAAEEERDRLAALGVEELAAALRESHLLPEGMNELLVQVNKANKFWQDRTVAAEEQNRTLLQVGQRLHDKMDDLNANTPDGAVCWFCGEAGYDGIRGLLHKDDCVITEWRAALSRLSLTSRQEG